MTHAKQISNAPKFVDACDAYLIARVELDHDSPEYAEALAAMEARDAAESATESFGRRDDAMQAVRASADEMAQAERDVFGDVCRCCDRPIETTSWQRLTEADRDAEGWPRCNECAAAQAAS